MRILQVCSARSIGGGEKHVASLANGLTQRGHTVLVALAPDSPVRSLLGCVPSDRIFEAPMRNALSFASAWKLRDLVRSNNIHIVHAHLGRDYPLAALAAGRAHARLVLTRHVMFPLSRVHKLTSRRAARVIAVSQPVADALQSQDIFNPRIIRVIHNGVDVERFAAAKRLATPNREKLRVGTVGELAPVKRHEDLIRAAQKICLVEDNVEFIIAGEDKSSNGRNQSHLQNLIVDSLLGDRVRLAPWVDDIAALVATFDLFVSTSETESFGMAMVEAMAAGVPVIATATAGAREIIDPDLNGRLVPIGDVEAIALAIDLLLRNPELRARLSAAGQASARRRFGLERMVSETAKLYEEVIAQSAMSVPAS
jgi:glycosyltransferase involved in cell wall biosynthesis